MRNPLQNREKQWTILELLRWTAAYFKSNAVEDPRASAEVLLAHVLTLKRIDLYIHYDQPLSQQELAAFKRLIKRRTKREPVAYIVGHREFWSMDLTVTPDVLIPRPETECLVEAALSVLESGGPDRVLELGTGSGAIVAALALERPQHRYFASDVSPAAAALARRNVHKCRSGAGVHFFSGNWFDPLCPKAAKFDLVVSNPPYIAVRDIATLQPEIRLFEPKAALDGGTDGLSCVRRIIDAAPAYLNHRGGLLMEIGHDQKSAVEAIALAAGSWAPPEFIKDYSGIDRIVRLRKRGCITQ